MNMVMQHIPFFESYQNWFVTHHISRAGFWCFKNQRAIRRRFFNRKSHWYAAINATAFIIGAMAFQVRDIKS